MITRLQTINDYGLILLVVAGVLNQLTVFLFFCDVEVELFPPFDPASDEQKSAHDDSLAGNHYDTSQLFEYRRQREDVEHKKNYKLKESYYLLHTPKVGGFGAKRLLDIDLQSIGKSKVCQQGLGLHKINHWSNWTTEQPNCVVHTAESVFSPNVPHTFAIVRPPLQHVVSQYFHCTESRSHNHSQHLMPPTIEVWLEEWNNARTAGNMTVVDGYHCYNPINLQSQRLGNPRGVHELLEQYDVIGILSQLDQSTCLMTIEMRASQQQHPVVPPRCNCSHSVAFVDDNDDAAASKSKPTQRHFVGVVDDHGVQHHGANYQMSKNATSLAKKLTEKDAILYNQAVKLFENHVQYAEQKHSFRMC